jgi:hypothetical protein
MDQQSKQDQLDRPRRRGSRREPTGVQGEPAATSALALSADSPRCSAMTKMGLPCGAARMVGKDRCYQHFASMEERSAAGRRGGLASKIVLAEKKLARAAARLDAPSFATAENTRSYLERASAAVAEGRIAPSQAKAIAGFAALAIRLGELELERSILDAEVQQAREQGQRR